MIWSVYFDILLADSAFVAQYASELDVAPNVHVTRSVQTAQLFSSSIFSKTNLIHCNRYIFSVTGDVSLNTDAALNEAKQLFFKASATL